MPAELAVSRWTFCKEMVTNQKKPKRKKKRKKDKERIRVFSSRWFDCYGELAKRR